MDKLLHLAARHKLEDFKQVVKQACDRKLADMTRELTKTVGQNFSSKE